MQEKQYRRTTMDDKRKQIAGPGLQEHAVKQHRRPLALRRPRRGYHLPPRARVRRRTNQVRQGRGGRAHAVERAVRSADPAGRTNSNEGFPELVDTKDAARLLVRPPDTLKRWRYEGVGPDWIEMEGKVMYEVTALLAYLQRNRRAGSVRLKG